MDRFFAASRWRGGALVGALLLAVVLAGPAAAQNRNLTATAKYSASSHWDEDLGDMTFAAPAAFDGNLGTRWNGYSQTNVGTWLSAQWNDPVTINKVVVREYDSRIDGIRIQRQEGSDWVDVAVLEGDQFKERAFLDGRHMTYAVRFAPLQTATMRVLITEVHYDDSQSIREIEAWNNPAGTLTGTVKDATGKAYAGVVVRSGDDKTVTNAEGKFTLVVDAGSADVLVSKSSDFRDRTTRDIQVAADATVTRDIVVVPNPVNLSLSATAVASSNYEGGTDFDAAKAKDGDLATRWNSDAGDTAGAYLEMQWSQPQTFNSVTIREAMGRIQNYTLQRYDASNDAYLAIPGWENLVPTGSGNRVLSPPVLAAPVTSTRLRLVINEASDLPSIYELEVRNSPVGTLKAVVKDGSGKPVPGATVTTDQGQVLGTTNAQGELSLLVEPNEFSLTASAEGYFQSAPQIVEAIANETREVNLIAPAQGTNLAKSGQVRASSEQAGAEAALATDGDLATTWTAEGDKDQWVGVIWDQPTRFTAIALRGFQQPTELSRLQKTDDGTTWVDLPATPFVSYLLTGPADFFFPAGQTARGVRILMSGTHQAGLPPGLAEFQVYDTPVPQP